MGIVCSLIRKKICLQILAKLQLKNLDIGFNHRVYYDPHSFTRLKDAIQFFSTSLFILITLSLGTKAKPSGIPPATYCCLLRVILKMQCPSSFLCFFFLSLLHISPLNTLYNCSCILFVAVPPH